MARGDASAQQGEQAGLAQNRQLFGQAGGLYSTLAPQLQAQAINPQGFGPATKARLITQNEETAGGTNAGVTGQAGLIEGRTRNPGSTGMALTKAAGEVGKNLSRANLSTNLEDEQLKQQQRDAALRGEEGLYGTSLGGGNQALGQAANEANANTNAVNASWDWSKDLLGPILGAASGPASKLIH